CKMLAEKYAEVDYLELETTKIEQRSAEYCSWIIEAKELDQPFRLQGNVRNDGYIDNLPQGCCVEVPVYIDRQGIRPLRVGKLPPQCAALNQSNITVQTLAVEAHVEADPEHVMHAIAMDPLTSAVCTLDEIRRMTAEMLEANKKWLPQFAGKSLRPAPHISIPRDLEPVEVPLDPALAVANRFGELATRETSGAR
ncbi:MAG: alpha-glucosidase/alpha-galactosidase, partial [Planctomycetota bacterium]